MSATQNNFGHFIRYANEKNQPQQLCMVFCRSSLQDEDYRPDRPITLKPLMCLDRSPRHLDSFEALCGDATLAGIEWDVLCMTAVLGQAGVMPTAINIHKRFDLMIGLISQGKTDKLVMFDRNGRQVILVS